MASSTADAFDGPSLEELATTMSTIKRMLAVAAGLAAIGYLLLLVALTQEFSTISPAFAEDSMKMWLKLGGIGHILIGIFIALVAIVRVLSLVPDRLGYALK